MRRKIVTLCGSVRFRKLFDFINREFTLDGFIVLSPGVWEHKWLHRPENNAELTKTGLDELHKDKIDMSDLVFIINKDKYIGKSTQTELDYAISIGKEIKFMEREIKFIEK